MIESLNPIWIIAMILVPVLTLNFIMIASRRVVPVLIIVTGIALIVAIMIK